MDISYEAVTNLEFSRYTIFICYDLDFFSRVLLDKSFLNWEIFIHFLLLFFI